MLKSIAPFIRHLRGRWRLLAALFLLGLAGSAASLATPLIGKAFIDAVAERGDFSLVPSIAAALVGLAVADVVIGFFSRFLHARLSADVLVSLRERLFRHCINGPLEGIEKFRLGDLLSRFGADVPRIQSLLVDGAIGGVHNILFLTVAAAILITLSPRLALWSFLGLGVALILTMFFRSPVERGTHQIREAMADLSHFFAERLGALRPIRMHGTQVEDEARLSSLNNELVSRVVRFQLVETAATSFPGLALSLSLAWIYLLGGGLLESGVISLGTFVAFVLYQGRLFAPAAGLLGLIRTFQEVRVSLERISEILEHEGEALVQEGGAKDYAGGLLATDVHFTYPGSPPLLRGVNLSISAGQRVALFGTSGAGKSTLVQLLFGLRRPQQGAVQYGSNVIGYAGSDPFLLHATIEENLRYGNSLASIDDMEAAARIAAADDFIKELPQGYQTIIGGRGHALSEGQRQRLGIARLVLSRPDILVFDEAFSALDPETETQVRHNLWGHFREQIILVVTHRLGGLNEFNRLYLLQNGILGNVDEQQLIAALGATSSSKTAADKNSQVKPAATQQKSIHALEPKRWSA